MFRFPWLNTGNRVADAQNARDKLNAARDGIRKQIEDVDTQLLAAQSTGAEELLAAQLGGSDDSGATLANIAHLGTKRATLTHALQVAEREIQAAQRELCLANAETRRNEASAKRAEADAREPRERELREALETYEECAYAPAAPTRHGPSGNQAGGAPFIVRVPTRKTQHLRMQADALESEAAEFERQAARLAPVVVQMEPVEVGLSVA